MPVYSYKIVDRSGKVTKGTLDAPSIDRLKSIVQEPGLYVTDIQETSALNRDIDLSRVKTKDLAIFSQQMASVLGAGVPITDAIRLTANTTQNSKLKKTLDKVLAKVTAGAPLSGSMGEFPDIFPPVMVHMIRAGEESGRQVEVFKRLANQLEKQTMIKNQVKKATSYPKMVLVVALLAIIVVCAYIVPMFVDVFNQLGTDLPFSTKIFIGLSKLFTNYWWAALIGAITIVAGWIIFSRSETGERFIDAVKRKAPLIKDLTIKTASADFARTMATLLSSGMDYPRALEISAETMSSLAYKDAIYKIHDDVINGASLTTATTKSEMFPELLTSLMKTGEETGDVSDMLTNAADYFEDEVQTATMSLTAALNPIIIIFMGLFIGLLVYSIYSPMFSMYNGIS